MEERARYRAFISYSHVDAAFGRKLHRRLETYRLPKRLVGRKTPHGTVPPKLAPIFRDLDELAASSDLTAEVREALKQSETLIVVCSPAAAQSKWVAREVEVFRELHPERPVLAAIADGAPPACFPPGLVRIAADGAPVEPLAADFRRGHDGERLGLLKLAAGITGLGLDELVQRDAQRQTQRVMAVTAAALVAVVIMGALTLFAFNAREEAVRQRGEAEGLVEYMLTDLRDRLKGVGRLDVMTAVNERALKYYSDQDIARLPVDSLERRARILHAMGEDDEARGNHDAALAKFHEAARTTSALLEQAPNDPERIFDQAQSEYWLGYVDYERRRTAEAKKYWFAYKYLVDKTIELEPQNPKYLREGGYADGNLCTIMLRPPVHAQMAVRLCSSGLTEMDRAATFLPRESGITDDLINRYAWLADAYFAAGDLKRARMERVTEGRILDGEMAADPKSKFHKADWVALQIALAQLDKAKRPIEARGRLIKAEHLLDEMIAADRTNQSWRSQRLWIQEYLAQSH